MRDDELFEGIDDSQSVTQQYLGLSLNKFLILLSLVLSFGIYLGVLLYGTNSVEIYLGLQDYEESLKTEIHRLRDENAELQREYFELKEISAQ